jgi:hypothetical protein
VIRYRLMAPTILVPPNRSCAETVWFQHSQATLK